MSHAGSRGDIIGSLRMHRDDSDGGRDLLQGVACGSGSRFSGLASLVAGRSGSLHHDLPREIEPQLGRSCASGDKTGNSDHEQGDVSLLPTAEHLCHPLEHLQAFLSEHLQDPERRILFDELFEEDLRFDPFGFMIAVCARPTAKIPRNENDSGRDVRKEFQNILDPASELLRQQDPQLFPALGRGGMEGILLDPRILRLRNMGSPLKQHIGEILL